MKVNSKIIATFLKDINRVFAIVLYRVKEPNIIHLLSLLKVYISQLLSEGSIDLVEFRKDITSIYNLDSDSKESINDMIGVHSDNEDTDNWNEIKKYIPIINEVIDEVCELLISEDYEKAYDLIDAIHCLPEALLQKGRWNARSYWKTYIGAYRSKWDLLFLYESEKEIVNTGFWSKLISKLNYTT